MSSCREAAILLGEPSIYKIGAPRENQTPIRRLTADRSVIELARQNLERLAGLEPAYGSLEES